LSASFFIFILFQTSAIVIIASCCTKLCNNSPQKLLPICYLLCIKDSTFFVLIRHATARFSSNVTSQHLATPSNWTLEDYPLVVLVTQWEECGARWLYLWHVPPAPLTNALLSAVCQPQDPL